jgi:hypothetical protein
LITYAWHGDDHYYATVVDRVYQQRPWPPHLRTQAIFLWITMAPLTFLPYAGLIPGVAVIFRCVWVAAVTAFCVSFPHLIKRLIVGQYRTRTTFGSKTVFKMDESEVQIVGVGAGHYPWSIYRRAVSYSDGLLLIRPGAARWLPHEASQEGTAAAAVALVQSHLPLRSVLEIKQLS